VGDIVKVMRRMEYSEKGMALRWNDYMDATIGKVFMIESFLSEFGYVSLKPLSWMDYSQKELEGACFNFPCFVLEHYSEDHELFIGNSMLELLKDGD
jgi:hypothetical protein